MSRKIVIIQGHPDPAARHFGRALADAYAHGAAKAGHAITTIAVGELDFPLLRGREAWEAGAGSPAITAAQAAIRDADHLAIFYPLWLGCMPALFKGFLEQVLRPGFAFGSTAGGKLPKKMLTGKSARVVVTMGMPAFVYRLYYRAHGIKLLERNILKFCGIRPVRKSIVGAVEGREARRRHWLGRMAEYGRAAI